MSRDYSPFFLRQGLRQRVPVLFDHLAWLDLECLSLRTDFLAAGVLANRPLNAIVSPHFLSMSISLKQLILIPTPLA